MKISKTKNKTTSPDYNHVLKVIARYKYITIYQFQALFAIQDYAQARKILFDLWENGYLERLIITKATRKISYSYVFVLSRKGARQLMMTYGLERVFYLKPNDQRSTLFLEHTVLINNFRTCLECLQRGARDFELTSWKQSKQQVKVTIS